MDKFDNTVLNLKILSRIPLNGRIRKSTLGKVTLEDEGYLPALRRFYYKDSRKQAINDINSILKDAFDEVHALLDSKYLASVDYGRDDADDRSLSGETLSASHEDKRKRVLDRLGIIYREMSGAINGLRNLKSTYIDDVSTVSALDWMVDKARMELSEIKSKCPYLQVDDEELS